MSTYTTERLRGIEDFTPEVCSFLFEAAERLQGMYGNKFDSGAFDFIGYARQGLFLVCRKDGELVGGLLARLYGSIFDAKTIILMQDELYCKPDSGRAAHLLMRAFIDFGKSNANHVLSMVGEHTNIKGRSLERLGFKKIEELYRLEV